MKEQYRHLGKYKEVSRTRDFTPSDNNSRHCTFCGAEVENDDIFCPECGNALGGIRCPNCGTLSIRNFCSNCNYPINELAQQAVSAAKRDPKFIRTQQLATELSELEERIARLSEGSTVSDGILDASALISDEDRAAAENYAALFGGIADLKVPDRRPPEPEEAIKRRQFSAAGDMLKAAVAEYKTKAAELQRQIASMLPDPGMPPEEKRNFFCARKITQIEMRATRQEWVCNYCGCHHRQPSECTRPELGGEWLFVQTPHPITKTIYD